MLTLDKLNIPFPNYNHIYHYTTANTAIEYILNEKEILFNSVRNTNDPLEFLDYCHVVSTNGEIGNTEIRRLIDVGHDINSIIKRKFKICCFCEDKEISGDLYSNNPIMYKGYCRSRMWSQYADDHKGVCLIFNKSRLIREITKDINIKHYEKKVIYDDNLPGLFDACDIEYDKDHNKLALERACEYIDKYLFMKLRDYEHENEFRIALLSDKYPNDDKIKVRINSSLIGIIVGTKFNDIYMPSIKKVKGKRIPIFKLAWFNGKPELLDVTKKVHLTKASTL